MTAIQETPAYNIDQQDCPNYLDDDLEVECEWTGNVMRRALDGIDTENGYEWDCPRCGNTSIWEGPDS